jgi:N-acetylmuramic acid 6-phosphate etherase
MADYPVEVITGPEFVTGSTRMKAGTAQKMVLNTISTATMIRLKRVQGNKMVYVKPANAKLKDRMVRIVMELTGRNRVESEHLLQQHNYDLHKALQ